MNLVNKSTETVKQLRDSYVGKWAMVAVPVVSEMYGERFTEYREYPARIYERVGYGGVYTLHAYVPALGRSFIIKPAHIIKVLDLSHAQGAQVYDVVRVMNTNGNVFTGTVYGVSETYVRVELPDYGKVKVARSLIIDRYEFAQEYAQAFEEVA